MANSRRPAPNVRARQLGQMLRALREQAKLSAQAVGAQIGVAGPTVTRWETAQSIPSKPALFALLTEYGVTDRNLREQYWALAQDGRARQWWDSYRDVLTPVGASLAAFEADATEIRIWVPMYLPGILQTEAYARAVFLAAGRTEDDADRLVEARIARQERVYANGAAVQIVLGADALRRNVVSGAAMEKQHALVAERAVNTSIRVLDRPEGWHPGLACGFSILTFAKHPDVVFVDGVDNDLVVEDPDGIVAYRQAFDRLASQAKLYQDWSGHGSSVA